MPRVYLIDNPQPNAFATGRNPENAAVAATTGLLHMLSRDELAGVMAHELAHIKNRDTLIMTVSATIAGAIATLAQFGFLFGGRGDDRPNPIVMLATALLAPHRRHDHPDGDQPLAGIRRRPDGRRDLRPARSRSPRRSPSIAGRRGAYPEPGCGAPPGHGARSSSSTRCRASGMDNLFSTHPATENRIAALHALAQEMGSHAAKRLLRAEFIESMGFRLGAPWRLDRHPPRALGINFGVNRTNNAGLGPRRLAWMAVTETLKRRVPLDDVMEELAPRGKPLARATRRSPAPSPSSPSGASAPWAMPCASGSTSRRRTSA